MSKTRTNKNICLFCFGDLDSARVCLSCKRPADDSPGKRHHLPQRTLLKNRYLVFKAIGEGGFGITYAAWDIIKEMRVAIKEYFPASYVDRAPKNNLVIIRSKDKRESANRGLKRFVEEARMLSRVRDLPGIVSVKDSFPENGTAYIVMEYLDGISLKKYIYRKGGKVSADEILGILNPVMTSLIFVHDADLIHRDISPDNIILTKYNEVKLIDFGAAKQSEMDDKMLSIVLKPAYAPEEQYRGNSGEQGPWTDVYALGVTIYYAVTGTLPPESVQRLSSDAIIPPSKLRAKISKVQEAALMKALEVNHKNRFKDVRELMGGFFGISPSQAVEFGNASMGAATVSDTVTEHTRTIFKSTQQKSDITTDSSSVTRPVDRPVHSHPPTETDAEKRDKQSFFEKLRILRESKNKKDE